MGVLGCAPCGLERRKGLTQLPTPRPAHSLSRCPSLSSRLALRSIICWTGLLIFILFAYHALSDGDFSFLMASEVLRAPDTAASLFAVLLSIFNLPPLTPPTPPRPPPPPLPSAGPHTHTPQTLGSLFALFAFGLLLAKAYLTGSVANISLKTLECYFLVFSGRLASILFYEGYLPYDRSGDWFYQFTEVSALLMVLALIVCVVGPFRDTYSRGRDGFKVSLVPGLVVAPELRVVQLVAPALVLAVLLHPSLNNNWLTDTAWAFALYLEAVAMLPQVWLFNEMQKVRLVADNGGAHTCAHANQARD
jgi:hypothetical protein